MKKILLSGIALTALIVASSAVASGLTISSNVGRVDMNCVGNNGGTGPAISVTSAPQHIWWGGVSGNFNAMNMQCKFTLHNNPSKVVGSAQLIVKSVPNQPGALCGTFLNVTSGTNYVLSAIGSNKAPMLQPAFFDYTVTMTPKA